MICLDSTFLIDFLKKKPYALRAADSFVDDAVTTEINVHEVLVGMFLHESPERVERQKFLFEGILSAMRVLPLDRRASECGAKIAADLIRRGKKIDVTDVLIAGVMRANSCGRILTRNVADFGRIDGLEVVSY